MEFTKDISFNSNPTAQKTITITYNGFLSNSSELWIVSGFGENWENTTETKMQKCKNGFSVSIKLIESDTFNFCFKNANNEWDNNNTYNYITPISLPDTEKIKTLFDELFTPIEPIQETPKFNIDELIEEILVPVVNQAPTKEVSTASIEITSEPIDLGQEVTRVLSQIDSNNLNTELIEYDNVEDILCGSVISESPVDLFNTEDSFKDEINEILENTSSKIENMQTEKIESTENTSSESNTFDYEKLNEDISEIVNNIEKNNESKETALIEVPDPFTISPRQLSKFYLFKKRLKLALYKAFVKIPKMLFGFEED